MPIRRLARLAAAIALGLAVAPAMAQPPAASAPVAAPPAQNEIPQIDINQGVRSQLPIAIADFSGNGPHTADVSGIIRNNLGRSGAFISVDPARFVERVAALDAPNFANWKLTQAQYLVSGQIVTDPDGRLRVRFKLWDINTGLMLQGQELTAPAETWRRVGHKISDVIYQRLTGESGYFDTRVAFVSESGPKTARRRVLGLMDQDGANPQFLTRAEDGMIFSPRFSASSQELTYMSLRDEGSQIYLFNLDTNRRETLGRLPGMAFAPRFSSTGGKIAFSLERGGNSDIYVMNLRSRAQAKLTSDPGIDTSPSFSPDDGQIVFNSDRAGSPQLYLMSADGSNQRRLSRGGGRYSDPVWSPRGDFIAFTKQTGGEFHIGVMRPDGSDERILTTSFLDESPTWAPNGRVLMFYRETSSGQPRLWQVDLNGRALPAQYSGPASDPAWSPLLD